MKKELEQLQDKGINKPRIYSFYEVQELLEEQKQEMIKMIEEMKIGETILEWDNYSKFEIYNEALDDILEFLNKK